ncbi:hypothetical protein GGI20_001477 [Coemansia sp. BCRC 34301]|nr:hypothetical protein GGI20_001477 [Coemansia sp. BCRC 34301]
MSASALLGSIHQAHLRLVTRTDYEVHPVYLNLVFKSYELRTTSQFALAYFCLIVMGVLERLGALGIDCIRDKPGQPWRIFPRACIYFLITLNRYLLMMAIMNGFVPMLLIVCFGLALGQIFVEIIRYSLMMWRAKKANGTGIAGFEPLKTPDQHRTTHLSESCC